MTSISGFIILIFSKIKEPMKNFSVLLLLIGLSGVSTTAKSQTTANGFTGAEAHLKHYRALYVLNSGDAKTINSTLRNIKNAMEDPRLKDKLEVELIVFGDGVSVFKKVETYETILKELQAKGVLLAQCENTIRERKIDKNSLFPFISYVPSGNGEIIIRQQQGWAVVHP